MRKARLAGAGAVAAALAAVALAAPGRAAAPAADPDAAALKAVCGRCHSLQLVQAQPRSDEDWRRVLQKMADLGADGSDEEFDGVVRYLHRNLTVVNVNTDSAQAVADMLGAPLSVGQAVVARRAQQPLRDLADLAAVAGLDATALTERKARILF